MVKTHSCVKLQLHNKTSSGIIMKYVDVVKSFINRNILYSFACFLMIFGSLAAGWDDPYTLTDYIALFSYLLGLSLMISPFHYKSYRMLYNLYCRFPKWLQPKPPHITWHIRRTFTNNIPNKWSTVNMVCNTHTVYDSNESCAQWCEDNSIGRYCVGNTMIGITSIPFSFKVHFEDATDAVMFRLANA
jgi:hypothetical protein